VKKWSKKFCETVSSTSTIIVESDEFLPENYRYFSNLDLKPSMQWQKAPKRTVFSKTLKESPLDDTEFKKIVFNLCLINY